ncbi:MAG: hypothetical protein KatS3mg035_2072 [Bacteroidia bacterium]|nr:MAG: hypothetical protein KatS3mg035_2072 [Bacteroidia bacterium]
MLQLHELKKHLALTYARNRLRYGNPQPSEPSRFIYEIDEQFLDFNKVIKNPLSAQNIQRNNISFNLDSLKKQPQSSHVSPTYNKNDFQGDPIEAIQVGNRVEHFKFGKGSVIQLEGKNDEKKAVVKFDSAGQKTLLLKFAKLKIIHSPV